MWLSRANICTVKARLKTELEENFERKFSNATAIPISHRTITTALDSDRRSPRDQHHRLQTEGAVSNTVRVYLL